MIPPFLATLGGKIAMGVLAAALVAGAIYAYNARQQSIGEDRIKVENAEQREAQHQRVLDIEREQHAKTQSILERRIEEDKRLKIANVQAQRKIKKLESDLERVTTFNEARHADDIRDVLHLTILLSLLITMLGCSTPSPIAGPCPKMEPSPRILWYQDPDPLPALNSSDEWKSSTNDTLPSSKTIAP